ncbi:MAG TPA: prolyl oligopeptidase family serine peptidase [Terriglobales bacterium]|nr:prolyl oligopeptidase family serine peptidase [Terriglobales bacterium]
MSGGFGLHWIFIFFLGVFAGSVWAADDSTSTTAPPGPPKAKVDDVVETIHGHKIADPYRWLEDANSPDTQEFVREELAYTRSILDPLAGREQIHQRLTQLTSIGTMTAPQIGGNFYFYTRREGTQNQPVLLVRQGIHGKDRPLVDVNQLAADGTVALDWWYPSDDGKYVAYGTSASGSEESTLHVIESATGTILPDTIEHTRFASLAWKKDNSGFYYTRRPKKGEVPTGEEVYHVKVFYHALGSDPASDPLIFGEGRNPQDIPQVALPDDDDRYLLITVFEGWVKSEMYLQDLKAGTPPVELTSGKEFLYGGEIFKGKLYITTNEDAPRFRVFAVDASNPKRENWKEIIPQRDAVLKGVAVFGGQFFAQYEKNASSQLRLFELDGKPIQEISLPAIGTIGGVPGNSNVGIGGRWDRKEAFYDFVSFTIPPTVYHVDLRLRHSEVWDKVSAPGIDPTAYEVNQVWYTSKDGTKVPMFVFHKKGLTLNGKNPTLLTGYGGFDISLTPDFRGSRYLWLEHGGVLAVANLRGGSEFGEDWHRAGMREKKQNVFDDFIAAAEFLIADKYTDKDHLAIQGGSNGGLLMGAAFTQRPDLFRAVVCQVPLLDMLRYQNFQIAKLWIPEYGSADDAAQFDWLYAYSPYHHVKAGTEYPAILFMTADTDTRVDPMHAKKMAALMQAEAANGQSRERPILLRIETKAGHGAGKPITKQIEEGVDIYSFLFWQLGVKE